MRKASEKLHEVIKSFEEQYTFCKELKLSREEIIRNDPSLKDTVTSDIHRLEGEMGAYNYVLWRLNNFVEYLENEEIRKC